jgi:hypothetical protein
MVCAWSPDSDFFLYFYLVESTVLCDKLNDLALFFIDKKSNKNQNFIVDTPYAFVHISYKEVDPGECPGV